MISVSLSVRRYRGSVEALPNANSAAGHVSSLCLPYNTIQFHLMAQKAPQVTQTQLRITRKKINNIAYWKRQGDEYFLSFL